jgi:hypothetical protein
MVTSFRDSYDVVLICSSSTDGSLDHAWQRRGRRQRRVFTRAIFRTCHLKEKIYNFAAHKKPFGFDFSPFLQIHHQLYQRQIQPV